MKFARHLETEWNPSYVDDAMDAAKRLELEGGVADALIEAVMGLMRTAAFERRIESTETETATRHPAHA